MRWLFVARLRPFVLLAAAASLLLNLALLMPSIYMIQVFDRVFSSRSMETLVMLSVLAVLALALGYCMDVVRSLALGWAGRSLDRRVIAHEIDLLVRPVAETIGAHVDGDGDLARDLCREHDCQLTALRLLERPCGRRARTDRRT